MGADATAWGWRRLRERSVALVRTDPAYAFLLATGFAAGISLPLARTALLTTFVLTLRDVIRGRRRWRFPATAWAWMAYLAVAVVTTAAVAAVNTDPLIVPREGLGKLTKLLWFLAIPLVPVLVKNDDRFRELALAIALGVGVEAAEVLLWHPPAAWIQVTLPLAGDPEPASAVGGWLLARTEALGWTERLHTWIVTPWRARTFNAALAKLAGMATAQRLMVGAVVCLALALSAQQARHRRPSRRLFALTVWIVAGLIVALKRGPWIATALVALPLMAAGWGLRRALPVLLLAVALTLALPAARVRLAELPREWSDDRGGRALMWRHIVPGLRRDHPWGVGFRGLTNDKMRHYARRVELFQNHVHSNPLQIIVELGWQGLAAYLAWMALALRDALRCVSPGPGAATRPGTRFLRAVPLAAITTLLLNGIVEYNFADGEMVILYGLAMGMASALCAERNPAAHCGHAVAAEQAPRRAGGREEAC